MQTPLRNFLTNDKNRKLFLLFFGVPRIFQNITLYNIVFVLNVCVEKPSFMNMIFHPILQSHFLGTEKLGGRRSGHHGHQVQLLFPL